MELEDSRSVASFYAHQELLEKNLYTPVEVNQKVDAVTQEDVERVAKKYIVNGTLNLAVIGNIENGQELQDLLKL